MEIKLTKKEFIDLYNSCTIEQLEKELGMSYFKLRRYADSLGLSKKPGRPKETYLFKDEDE